MDISIPITMEQVVEEGDGAKTSIWKNLNSVDESSDDKYENVEECILIGMPLNQGKKIEIKLQGDFKNIRSPTYDGECEELEGAWLLYINQYFQAYDYPRNLKAKLATYQLQSKYSLWWEDFWTLHNFEDNKINFKESQIIFKEKYLTKIYYDEKEK